MPNQDDSSSAVILFRDPSTRLRVTPTIFAQLPERDFMDHETGKLISSHHLHGRVIWYGHVWLVFTDEDDPIPALYKYKLVESDRPGFVLRTEQELQRLLRVIEALYAYHCQLEYLPVRLAVCGRAFFSPLYTHPCVAVRYPMMGLDETGRPGAARQKEISEWMSGEGFNVTDPDCRVPKIIGIMESIIHQEEVLLKQWESTRQSLSRTGQIFLSPEVDEMMVDDILKRMRSMKSSREK